MNLRELLFKIDGSRVFVVVKDVFESFPGFLSSGTGFENGVKEIERDGAIDPLLNDRIETQPGSIFGDLAVFRRYDMVLNFEGGGGIDEQFSPRSVVHVFHFKGDLYVIFDVGD